MEKVDKFVGFVSDDYEIVNYLGRKFNSKRYCVRCKICGNEKENSIRNFLKQNNAHSSRNCKEKYYESLIGEMYGDYKCVGFDHVEKHGYLLRVRCNECGNEKMLSLCELRDISHSQVNCGEKYAESIIGNLYGDLLVERQDGFSGLERTYLCKCQKCGIESRRTERTLRRGIKHGTECLKQIPESEIKRAIISRFKNMKARCNNPNNEAYHHYGGRGIMVEYESAVDLYLDFHEEFRKHAIKYGIRNSTFDRIDVNGNYKKDNIRITTQKVQSTNTTRKKIFILEKDGERIISDSAKECGRKLGVNGRSIGNVIRGNSKSCGGWKLYRIVSEDEDVLDVIGKEFVTKNYIIA